MAQHTKSPSNTSKPRRVQEVLLTLGALAGLASIVFFVAGLAFNITPLIFKSGSMSPTIDTGALAFAHTVPASEVQVGDIVSVYDSQGTRITHRVETIDQQGNNLAVAQLRGDANPITDPDPYVITEADRVFFSVDRLGYVAVWLSGPSGFVLGAIAVCGLSYIAFRPRKKRSNSGPGEDDTHVVVDRPQPNNLGAGRGDSHALKVIIALATVGLSVAGIANIGGTQAGFTGSATAGSATFTTAASFPTPPASLSCTGNGTSVTLTWPATAGQSYRIIVRNATNTTQPPLVRDVASGSTTLTLSDLPSGGILLSNTNYDVEVHALTGTVVTPEYTGYRVSSSTALILFSSVSCVSGPTSGTTAVSALAARSAPAAGAPSSPASTSTTAAGSATSASTTPTTTPAQTTTTSSTAVSSTTTSTPTPTTGPPTTPATTATSTTPTSTTTAPPITTTPSEVPIGTPAATTGFSAQKLSTAGGTVVSVSNSSGTEVYRGTVDSDAVLHWLTGTDQLYVISTAGVTVIDTSTGVWAESPATSELPDEIKALVP